jgi:Ca2+-binding EF-hand superfamily protein
MSFTDDQLSDIKEAFSLFDRSGQGIVEPNSIGDLLRAIGYNPTQAQAKEMVTKLNNQGLNFDAFIKFLETDVPNYKFANPSVEELVQGFQVFDKEGNGFISVGELRYGKNQSNLSFSFNFYG